MKTLFAIAAVGAGLSAGPAYADGYPPWVLVIRDCAANGRLDQTYRHEDLEKALHELPSDGGEYSDCAMVIRHALTGGSGSTMTPPPNAIVTESGAIAASRRDVAQLETVVAAVDTGEPPAVNVPTTSRLSFGDDVVLTDLGPSAAVPYRPDFLLIAGVITAGLAAISAAAARARRRAAA